MSGRIGGAFSLLSSLLLGRRIGESRKIPGESIARTPEITNPAGGHRFRSDAWDAYGGMPRACAGFGQPFATLDEEPRDTIRWPRKAEREKDDLTAMNANEVDSQQAFQQQPHLAHFGPVVKAFDRRHVDG